MKPKGTISRIIEVDFAVVIGTVKGSSSPSCLVQSFFTFSEKSHGGPSQVKRAMKDLSWSLLILLIHCLKVERIGCSVPNLKECHRLIGLGYRRSATQARSRFLIYCGSDAVKAFARLSVAVLLWRVVNHREVASRFAQQIIERSVKLCSALTRPVRSLMSAPSLAAFIVQP